LIVIFIEGPNSPGPQPKVKLGVKKTIISIRENRILCMGVSQLVRVALFCLYILSLFFQSSTHGLL
jgi:Ca2+/H+ antiporter